MAQIVVTDAGPLIALAQMDYLFVLGNLFGTVWVPIAVQQECMAKPGLDTLRIQQAIEQGILKVAAEPAEPSTVQLPRSLGAGEKAALHLAIQNANTLLIMDDYLARKQAIRMGFNLIGTVGLLDIAEKRGLIGSAEDAITAIRQSGYRISTSILQTIRKG